TIAIQDARGKTVRTLNGPQTAGVHRVYWDLRDTVSKRVTFRTSPLYAPEIRVGPDGIRESEGGFGAGGGGLAMLQAPGTYTVKLSVGGRSEEHRSELQSLADLVCRLLLEKKKVDGLRQDVGLPDNEGDALPGDPAIGSHAG